MHVQVQAGQKYHLVLQSTVYMHIYNNAADAAVNCEKLTVTHTFQIPVTIVRVLMMQPKILKNKVPFDSEIHILVLADAPTSTCTFICIRSTSPVRTRGM